MQDQVFKNAKDCLQTIDKELSGYCSCLVKKFNDNQADIELKSVGASKYIFLQSGPSTSSSMCSGPTSRRKSSSTSSSATSSPSTWSNSSLISEAIPHPSSMICTRRDSTLSSSSKSSASSGETTSVSLSHSSSWQRKPLFSLKPTSSSPTKRISPTLPMKAPSGVKWPPSRCWQ